MAEICCLIEKEEGMNNGYVRISRQFDVEVDYMVTKFSNAVEKERDKGLTCDYETLGRLETKLEESLLIQDSMSIDSTGTFCVPKRLAKRAREYRDFYRFMH